MGDTDPRVERAARAFVEQRHPEQHDRGIGIAQGSHYRSGFIAGAVWQHQQVAALAAADSVTPTQGAAEVLVDHQRQGSHSCLCGDLPLGSSFAQHQVDMLAARGLLVTKEADRG